MADKDKDTKKVKKVKKDGETATKKKKVKDDEKEEEDEEKETTTKKKKKSPTKDEEDAPKKKEGAKKKTKLKDDADEGGVDVKELEQQISEKDKEIGILKSQLQEEKKKLEVEILQIKKQHDVELAKLQAEHSKASATGKSEAKKEESNAITFEPKTGTSITINGEWKGPSAGGCMNNLTWRYNPQIFIRPSRTLTATIKLLQPPASTLMPIGWYLFEGDSTESRRLLIASEDEILLKCNFSKAESCEKTVELKKSAKPYVLIPSTYNPGEEVSFTVSIQADAEIVAQLISKDQEWPQPTIMGEWAGETAGGCPNFDTFPKNPQYILKIEKQSQVKFLLLQEKFSEFDNISMYVVEIEQGRTQKITEKSVVKDKNKVAVSPKFEDPQTFSASASLKPGTYAIIPTTFDAGQEAPFKLMVLSDTIFPPIRELQDAACLSITGVWSGDTAGGCLNNVRSWRGNAQYLLTVSKEVDVTIKVKQTSIIGAGEIASLGFYIFTGGKKIVKPKKKNIFLKSKFVKKNDGLSQKVKIPASDEPYIIVPCTFHEGQEGAFTLSIYSDDPSFVESVKIENLPLDRDMQKFVAKGAWEGPTAGGCLNYATWRNNPQFLLDVSKTSEIHIFLTCKTDKTNMKPGFYVVNAPTNSNLKVDMKKGEEPVLKCPFVQDLEVSKSHKFEPGRYIVIPCTYDYASESKFEVTVYAEEFNAIEFKSIPAGLLSIRGEWTPETAGGCINDVKSWFTNPKFFLAVKQHTEVAAVLIQSPSEDNIPQDQLLEIGFYITNSDGDGKQKVNEEKDLVAKANFAPDKDSVSVCTLPSSHWPYVITPCTFKPGLTGKFEITVLMDKEALEYVELSNNPIVINPAEVIGAGEDPAMREVRRRFKPLSGRTLELVQFTETTPSLPEHLKFIGRTLLQTVAQFQDSVVAWGDNVEPQWWLEGYEEYPEEEESPPPPPPPTSGPPPPPPPPKLPTINFSKPVKMQMVDTGKQSAMSQEMIDALETKKQNFIDELLTAVQGGIKNLKKVEVPVKPPPPTNSFDCAFNIEILNKRRAALEGLHDKPDEDAWDDVEDS